MVSPDGWRRRSLCLKAGGLLAACLGTSLLAVLALALAAFGRLVDAGRRRFTGDVAGSC